jgi:FKBP-type peptidyl-prolyl cis-trans isomerase (trigger factor)
MNITKEQTGVQTATLKIEIAPGDYAANVQKLLKDYQKKASIPGFRPGHVPAGLIKKMYGKAVVADEVNKLLTDSLSSFIRDEKLNILGSPMPNKEKTQPINFEDGETMEFYFDLGFAPEFELKLDGSVEVEDYSINIEEEMLDKYIEETRKRYGDHTQPEIVPAELNSDLYAKVYPGRNLETYEDFRVQVRKDASSGFNAETDKVLFNNISETLVKTIEIGLPDDFLKRWLRENDERPYTDEEIEKQYPAFADSMRWQLIENRIIRDHHIEVTDEDIRKYIRTILLRQIDSEPSDPEKDSRYEAVVDAFMQNKEQVQRITDQLYNARLLELFKSTLRINTKEISYEEFVKLVSEKHTHDQHHDHDHEHEHDHDHEHHHSR